MEDDEKRSRKNKNLSFNQNKMKNFRTKLSVTKLVLIIMVLILGFQTVYLTLQWVETSLFNNVMLSIIAFYFGQKSMQYSEPDSLMKDLPTENEKNGSNI